MRRLRQVRKGMPCGGHQHGRKGAVHCKKHKGKRGGRTTFGSPSCATCFWGCSISCLHGLACCFLSPLFVAIIGGSKAYCNRYCGRGQLFSLLGEKLKLSPTPRRPSFCAARGSAMVFNLLYGDVRPDAVQHLPGITGAPLSQTVTLLWVFKLRGSGRM